MNAKQMRALAKANALAAARKVKEANAKADPVIDSWITRVTAKLVASPYTGPLIVAAMIGVCVLAIVVLL